MVDSSLFSDRSQNDQSVDPTVEADEEAVFKSFVTGKALALDVSRRVHERAQAIRKRVQQAHGLVDIGVPAIRELRGDPA